MRHRKETRVFSDLMEKKAGASRAGRDEQGFITVVVVLLMLVLVTIIGVSAINMTTIESTIVRTDGLYKRNFYVAESAAYEAAQLLENTAMTETNPTGGVPWIVPTGTDMTDWTNWRDDNGTATNFSDDTWTANSTRSEAFFTTDAVANPANLNMLLPPRLHTGDSVRLAAHYRGLAGGSSLKVTNEEGRLYAFNVYGMFSNLEAGEGEVLIEMGYRKRF